MSDLIGDRVTHLLASNELQGLDENNRMVFAGRLAAEMQMLVDEHRARFARLQHKVYNLYESQTINAQSKKVAYDVVKMYAEAIWEEQTE